jgi:RND family efflux transporter MFP subunit
MPFPPALTPEYVVVLLIDYQFGSIRVVLLQFKKEGMKVAVEKKKFTWLQAAGWCLSVMLVLSLCTLTGCRKKKVEKKVEIIKPVKLTTVKERGVKVVRTFPGKVRAARRSVLSFKVSGPLVKLPVDEGQFVNKGDLIAQIDQRDFINAVNEARARYREAEQQFKRYKELYAKKQVSKADYDRYRAARDVAAAQLADARNALGDTTLKAPFDGVISKRYVENYYKVQAKEPIVNLQDISRIEILVDVPELFIAEIRDSGMIDLQASFESLPGKKFPLKIKEYSTQADPATQTYQVVLVMDRPEGANILPGMTAWVTATVRDVAGKMSSHIIIPAIAVMDAPGNKPCVWVYDEKAGVVHKREVKVGSLDGSSNIVITSGLKPGEMVVIAGVTKLEEGMKVRPWEKQREGK